MTAALLAVVGFGANMSTSVRADATTQGAEGDASGVVALASALSGPPISVGPLAPSGVSVPNGGTSPSIGTVVNCANCVPGLLSTGVINTSSAATLSSALNNCTQAAGFPLNNLITFFTGTITGGQACASVASPALASALPGSILTADAVQTQSTTQSCTATPMGHAGIVGLKILGTVIPVSALPVNLGPNTDIGNILPALGPAGLVLKTTLQTLGITIILNEQHYDNLGHGLTVNGIHIILTKTVGQIAAGDIVIAHSHSQATCSDVPIVPPPPNPCVAPGCTVPPVTPVVTKDDSTHTVPQGGTLQYRISVAQKVQQCGDLTLVVDILPPGFTYVPPPVSGPLGAPTVGTQGGSGRQTLTWAKLGGFAGLADPVTEVINVAVSSTAGAGVTYFNEVDVTSQKCGTVHGTDGGVKVTSVLAATATPSLINTAAAGAPGTDGPGAAVIVVLGLAGLSGLALVARGRRRKSDIS